jgi:hypothetical protein
MLDLVVPDAPDQYAHTADGADTIGPTTDGVLLYDSQTMELDGPGETKIGGQVFPKAPMALVWVRNRPRAGGYRDRRISFYCDSRSFLTTDEVTVDAQGHSDFRGHLNSGVTWPPESDIEGAGTTLCELARKTPAAHDTSP